MNGSFGEAFTVAVFGGCVYGVGMSRPCPDSLSSPLSKLRKTDCSYTNCMSGSNNTAAGFSLNIVWARGLERSGRGSVRIIFERQYRGVSIH
jgi:hypothetical protein